jgi:hypothetical protein
MNQRSASWCDGRVHCVAVPVRGGVDFKKLAHRTAWEAEYKTVTRVSGRRLAVNLETVLREMRTG